MKKLLIGGLVAAAGLLISVPASAVVTYESLLEYRDTGTKPLTASATPFGKVLIEEINPYKINVTVTLFSPQIAFLNTGGKHEPFVFNLTGNYPVTVTNTTVGGKTQTFYNGGYDSDLSSGPNFVSTPFGSFTNMIGCCGDENGAVNASPPPLTFSVYDANGITFAGAGAILDGNSKLFKLGTGDRFASNSKGWWFAADVVTNTGETFNIAARDAYRTSPGPVPEPASWALMITGFGVVGVSMRRGKAAQRQTHAA